jgi:branched-chain amino acid transport system ATP-binding protein
MTVEENILVGALFGSPSAATSRRDRARDVGAILEFLGLGGRRSHRVRILSVTDRKKVDLGRALAMNPQVLLLDELMAGLPPGDTEEMMAVIREIRRRGVSLVIIEHVMNVIVSLCSRVLVLHQGRKIADGPARDIMRDREVLRAYLGAAFTEEVLDRGVPASGQGSGS